MLKYKVDSSIKGIILFTMPIVIGMYFHKLYSAIDTVIVDRLLGDNAMMSVAATDTYNDLIVCLTRGLILGFSVHIAKIVGMGDHAKLKNLLSSAMIALALIGIAAFIALWSCGEALLNLVNVPDTLFQDALVYFQTIIIGVPMTLFYSFSIETLRSFGDTRTPLIISTIGLALNLALDLTFIQLCNAGVRGAGFATLLSRLLVCIACFIYMFKKYPESKISFANLNFKEFKKVFSLCKSGLAGCSFFCLQGLRV